MRKTIVIVLLTVAVTLSVIMNGCSKHADVAAGQTTALSFTVPAGFPEPQYKFEGNPLKFRELGSYIEQPNAAWNIVTP